MIANFRESNRGDVADSVCKACLLLPGAIKLADLPIQKLRDATSNAEYEEVRPWFVACCGLASYREGKYDEAIAWTKKHPDLQGLSGALALLVRAMAEYELGQTDQAKQTLSQAEDLIPVSLRTLGNADYAGPLPAPASDASHDWLAPEILRREAKSLIGDISQPKESGPTTKPVPIPRD
jgi:tetratricopeptide (TPR) repeat protein